MFFFLHELFTVNTCCKQRKKFNQQPDFNNASKQQLLAVTSNSQFDHRPSQL